MPFILHFLARYPLPEAHTLGLITLVAHTQPMESRSEFETKFSAEVIRALSCTNFRSLADLTHGRCATELHLLLSELQRPLPVSELVKYALVPPVNIPIGSEKTSHKPDGYVDLHAGGN